PRLALPDLGSHPLERPSGGASRAGAAGRARTRRGGPPRPRRPDRGGRMSPHAPVLLAEVLEALEPKPGDVIIDATFGAGGYTRATRDRGGCEIDPEGEPAVEPFAGAVARDCP